MSDGRWQSEAFRVRYTSVTYYACGKWRLIMKGKERTRRHQPIRLLIGPINCALLSIDTLHYHESAQYASAVMHFYV